MSFNAIGKNKILEKFLDLQYAIVANIKDPDETALI